MLLRPLASPDDSGTGGLGWVGRAESLRRLACIVARATSVPLAMVEPPCMTRLAAGRARRRAATGRDGERTVISIPADRTCSQVELQAGISQVRWRTVEMRACEITPDPRIGRIDMVVSLPGGYARLPQYRIFRGQPMREIGRAHV